MKGDKEKVVIIHPLLLTFSSISSKSRWNGSSERQLCPLFQIFFKDFQDAAFANLHKKKFTSTDAIQKGGKSP